jgi:transposase
VALHYIGALYRIESEAKKAELSAEELVKIRQEKARKIFAEFYAWLAKKKTQVVPKSLLGKAVNYALSQWARLLVYLDHGSMTPDNNRAENAIRPLCVGQEELVVCRHPRRCSGQW